jgi:hypothetical protein
MGRRYPPISYLLPEDRIRKRYRAIVRRAVVSPPTSSPSDDDSRQEDANENLANSFEDLDVPQMNTPTASLQFGERAYKERCLHRRFVYSNPLISSCQAFDSID